LNGVASCAANSSERIEPLIAPLNFIVKITVF
jgi:hypothetical protein